MIDSNLSEHIKKLLYQDITLADNDNRLVAVVMYHVLKDKNIDPERMSAVDYLGMYSKKRLPSTETICRIRRKLQEQYPELRGEKYSERQGKESKVRKEIRQLAL